MTTPATPQPQPAPAWAVKAAENIIPPASCFDTVKRSDRVEIVSAIIQKHAPTPPPADAGLLREKLDKIRFYASTGVTQASFDVIAALTDECLAIPPASVPPSVHAALVQAEKWFREMGRNIEADSMKVAQLASVPPAGATGDGEQLLDWLESGVEWPTYYDGWHTQGGQYDTLRQAIRAAIRATRKGDV